MLTKKQMQIKARPYKIAGLSLIFGAQLFLTMIIMYQPRGANLLPVGLFWPIICVLVSLCGLAVCSKVWFLRRQTDMNLPCCDDCGYNLTGNQSGTCPECGHTVQSSR